MKHYTELELINLFTTCDTSIDCTYLIDYLSSDGLPYKLELIKSLKVSLIIIKTGFDVAEGYK